MSLTRPISTHWSLPTCSCPSSSPIAESALLMVSRSSSFSRCSSSSGVRFSFVPVLGFARAACPALRGSPLPPGPARERALEPHTLTSQSAPSSHLMQEKQATRPDRGRAAACKDPRCRHRCAPGPPEQLLQCSKALLPGGIALTMCSAWLPCALPCACRCWAAAVLRATEMCLLSCA